MSGKTAGKLLATSFPGSHLFPSLGAKDCERRELGNEINVLVPASPFEKVRLTS